MVGPEPHQPLDKSISALKAASCGFSPLRDRSAVPIGTVSAATFRHLAAFLRDPSVIEGVCIEGACASAVVRVLLLLRDDRLGLRFAWRR